MKARLLTRTGHFVAEVDLPPFRPSPEILLWGSRYFYRRDDSNLYHEGLAWFIAGPPSITKVEAVEYPHQP